MITTLPTTAAEAAHIGEDLLKNKGGELLSTLSGGLVTTVPTSGDEAKRIGETLMKKMPDDLMSKATGLPMHSKSNLHYV